MKEEGSERFTLDTDIVERLAAVTEQLEEIVSATKGKKVKEPEISLERLSTQTRKRIGDHVPMALFTIFRMLALKNLLRGRMQLTAYSVGKHLGFSLKVKSQSDLLREIARFEMREAKIKKLDEKGVDVQFSSTLTSLGIDHSSRPICYFEGGLLSGALEKWLGRKVDLAEESCCAAGDDACVFRTSFTELKKKLRTRAASIAPDMYTQENIKLLTSLASHSITAIENTLLFEKARRQVVVDGLTQVYNHRYFQQALRVETRRAMRHSMPISLMMVDIDGFKKYNDRYGHPKGDDVLKAVARMFIESVRDIDIVARYGGDEFCLILPQTNLEGALTVFGRIVNRMKEMTFSGKTKRETLRLSLTAGIAGYDAKKPLEPSLFLEKADRALLGAKKKGTDKVKLTRCA